MTLVPMLLGGGLISLSKLNLGDECKKVPEIISREVVEALLRNRRALGSALDYVKGKAYITGGLLRTPCRLGCDKRLRSPNGWQ
jgi:hypothetical protein